MPLVALQFALIFASAVPLPGAPFDARAPARCRQSLARASSIRRMAPRSIAAYSVLHARRFDFPHDRNPFAMTERNYWIGVVSQNHVEFAIAGGFTQLNHGKAAPLERMARGDGFVFYSPRAAYPDGAMLQAFTAIGRIRDGNVYRVDAGEDFHPFRLAVDYLPASPAPIRPLIGQLSFIRSKEHWGAAFRFGVVHVPADDFARIATAMGRSVAADFG